MVFREAALQSLERWVLSKIIVPGHSVYLYVKDEISEERINGTFPPLAHKTCLKNKNVYLNTIFSRS